MTMIGTGKKEFCFVFMLSKKIMLTMKTLENQNGVLKAAGCP